MIEAKCSYFALTGIVNLLWRFLIWPITSVGSHGLTNKLTCTGRAKRSRENFLIDFGNKNINWIYTECLSDLTWSDEYSPCSLWSENHSNICWSSCGYFGVKRPNVVRFADIFRSPLIYLVVFIRSTINISFLRGTLQRWNVSAKLWSRLIAESFPILFDKLKPIVSSLKFGV